LQKCAKTVGYYEWNSSFLRLALNTEHATEKVTLFVIPLVSLQKNLCINEKDVFLTAAERIPVKISFKLLLFFSKMFTVYLFRAACMC
jgi:hypothetical protein